MLKSPASTITVGMPDNVAVKPQDFPSVTFHASPILMSTTFKKLLVRKNFFCPKAFMTPTKTLKVS